MLIGPWAGKALGFQKSVLAAAWGLLFLLLAVGPCPWINADGFSLHYIGIGPDLMFGFRHFFLQNGANRVGSVQPSEWQMSTYIPMAYYFPRPLGFGGHGGHAPERLGGVAGRAPGLEQAQAGGHLREDPGPRRALLRRLSFVRFAPRRGGRRHSLPDCVGHGPLGDPRCLGPEPGLGLACLVLFLMGGFRKGAEAFLWILGGCFCFMVCGAEFKFVADRMNTIFKVWMNGWILMGLVFGAGFASALERPSAPALKAKAPKARVQSRPRRVNPAVLIPWLAGLGLILVLALAAGLDARLMMRGGRFIASYLVFGVLIAGGPSSGRLLRGVRLVALGQARALFRAFKPWPALSARGGRPKNLGGFPVQGPPPRRPEFHGPARRQAL